jgi:hypothetical protein
MNDAGETRKLLVIVGAVLLTTFVLGLWANTAQWVGMKAAKSATPGLQPADIPEQACQHCSGTGKGPCWSCTVVSRPFASRADGPAGWCQSCLSTGKVKCTWCGGTGKVRSLLPMIR